MAEPGVAGDLILRAEPATPEAFEPYGRLLYGGDRARLGGRARVLVALDAREAGPRRVRHLQRYPEAARLVLSLSDAPLVLVVCGPGERPAAPAVAFRVPGGVAVLLHAGVWHAGPVPLADTTVLEMLEIRGATDHLDRRTVSDLLGAEGLRIAVPDEPVGPSPAEPPADESIPVAVEADLRGRVRYGLLAIDGIVPGAGQGAPHEEAAALLARVRAAWRPGEPPPPEIAARLAALREAQDALGVPSDEDPSAVERLLERVVEGVPLPRTSALAEAVALASLETLCPAQVHDRARIRGKVALRVGARGEGFAAAGRAHASVEGRPVLADREGPFSALGADAVRTRATAATERALVVVHLPSAADDADATRVLDRFATWVARGVGGAEAARRVVP